LLERHVAETGSSFASSLLDDWESTSGRVTAVTPRDFRKVTGIRVEATRQGRDPDGDEVWAEILEVTRG
jgi:glutamate synthase (NADPH/NADH) large chain